MSSRFGAYSYLVLGSLGVLLGFGFLIVVWLALPRVGRGLADLTEAVRTSVEGMNARLDEVHGALSDTDQTLQALGAEEEGDPERVKAERRQLREDLAPLSRAIREDLRALQDTARGIEDLLRALDLPFVPEVGRAGTEFSSAIGERLPHEEKEVGDDLALDPTAARALLGEAQGHVGDWRQSLAALGADLAELEQDIPCAMRLLAVLLSLLALWGIAGQACLFRTSWGRLRQNP